MTSEKRERRMNAYYYGFEETGCDPVDDVLEAVARAGKAFHHTDQWSNPDFPLEPGKLCETDKIQNAATASAEAVRAAIAAAEARGREQEREHAASLIQEMFDRFKPGAGRIALAVAERAVKRGRHLTAGEQLENLAAAIEEDDAELAAAIRAKESPPHA